MESGRARRAVLLVIVGLLTALAPLGVDAYLPALPQVTDQLGAPDGVVQLSLLIFLVGMGAGQFVWGPVSDRFGRRGPLLLALGGFIVAMAVCALAPSIWVLVIARLVAGLSGSGGVVIARAIIRDLYEGEELRRIFGWLSIIFGLAPIVGPVLGAGILQFTDWRGTFWALVALGALFIVATLAAIPETLVAERRVHGESAERSEAWRAPVRNPVFVTSTLTLICTSFMMFFYVSFIPFVMQEERGLTDLEFGIMFGVTAIAVLTGGQLAALLAGRMSGARVVQVAAAVTVVGGLCILLSEVLDWPTPLLYVVLWITVFAIAVIQPTSLALAIAPFARGAGTASAIAGGTQFLIAATSTGILANVFGSGGVVMGTAWFSAAVAAFVIAFIGGAIARRQGTLARGRAQHDPLGADETTGNAATGDPVADV